ncbi:MAG: hypothetical protein WKG01_21495, partial [Kofleriaceae bacterium]
PFERERRSIWKRVALAKRDEVRSSAVLRYYGIALVAIHLLTLVYFARHDLLVRTITSETAVCWPFLPGCEAWRAQSARSVEASMVVYGVVAALAIVCFARREHVGKALIGLACLDLIKAGWVLHDYRLMGNYHYMPFILTTAYLVLPAAKDVSRYLVVAFYVSAGVLKLDREWLSGAALIAPTWLTGRWLELGCALVVVLELVVSLGLLVRARLVRWAALVALAGFHLYSWHVVGFFYPLVMFALLAIFPLAWWVRPAPGAEPGIGPESLAARLVGGKAGWSVYAMLSVYGVAQLAPAMFPGDTAITGEGRMFSLNMMDARVTCDHFSVARLPNGSWREVSDLHPRVGVRIQCDPIRYVSLVREACEHATTVSTYLTARRTTDASYQPVFAVDDACGLQFAVFSHNSWIGAHP